MIHDKHDDRRDLNCTEKACHHSSSRSRPENSLAFKMSTLGRQSVLETLSSLGLNWFHLGISFRDT